MRKARMPTKTKHRAPARLHALQRASHKVERARKVERHLRLHLVQRQQLGRARQSAARIGDNGIYPAVTRRNRVDRVLDRRVIGNVNGNIAVVAAAPRQAYNGAPAARYSAQSSFPMPLDEPETITMRGFLLFIYRRPRSGLRRFRAYRSLPTAPLFRRGLFPGLFFIAAANFCVFGLTARAAYQAV